MAKYYFIILVVWIVSIVIIGTGFYLAGTPVSQKSVQLDTTRMGDFSNINSAISTYFGTHQKLPPSLSDITNTYTVTTDPETRKPYTYQPVSATSYKLCTTFSLASKDLTPTPNYTYNTIALDTSHKKGYDCITYTLPTYLISPTPTPFVYTATPPFTQYVTPTPDSNHACSTVYNGICRPKCGIYETAVSSAPAVADCAKNSVGNPVCCSPTMQIPLNPRAASSEATTQ